MSVSNWETCPKCVAQAKAEADEKAKAVEALYGEVPVAEFEEQRAQLETVDPGDEKYETFREDYEWWGASEGTIQWHYHGKCETCGLSTEVKGSKQFWELQTKRFLEATS